MHELLAQYAANKNRIAERREKLKNENNDSIRFCEEQVINAKEIDIMYPLLDAVNEALASLKAEGKIDEIIGKYIAK